MSDFLKDMGIAVLPPQVLKLPFVGSFINGGPYIAHPSEPPLFSRFETHFNRIWIDWLWFVMKVGPDNGDLFDYRVHKCEPEYMEVIRKMAQKLGEAILADMDKLEIVLPKKPPSLRTTNGLYVSHAWVLDIARRDNMPVHEAVALGCSLGRS